MLKDNSNLKFCLNIEQYKKVKKINQLAFEVIDEVVNKICEMFEDIHTYISNPCKLSKQVNKLYLFSKIYRKTLEKVIATPKSITKENIRYYDEKDYELIMDSVFHQEDILVMEIIDIRKLLTQKGNKKLDEIINQAETKIIKLERILEEIYVSSTIGFRFLRLSNMAKKIRGEK